MPGKAINNLRTLELNKFIWFIMWVFPKLKYYYKK